MKLLSSFIAFALVGLLVATPISEDDDTDIITESYYLQNYLKYEGKHDIVNIVVPLNSLNFNRIGSKLTKITNDIILFFVEADVQPDESRVDQGLYVLKGGKAEKILEHGRDAAASRDDSKLVFFAANDGLYVYNEKTNSADKYGLITDSIIGIATVNDGSIIYILTEDHEVYKVTNNGDTKEKIEDIVNAQQIVLDNSNNLYFYSIDKALYVLTNTGVKKIEGLPKRYSKVRLNKPPYVLEDKIPVLIDNKVYFVYANGASQSHGLAYTPKAIPTASALEATFIQYDAYDKKIYEHDISDMISQLPDLENPSSDGNVKESDTDVLSSKLIGQPSKA